MVPSRQRAAVVRLAYASLQLERGRELWRTPDVLSWAPWLEREVARAAEGGAWVPRALRGAEEWVLWRQAVESATRELGCLMSDSLAEALHRAAYRLFEWRIPPDALRRAGSAESELLARALEAFDARCAPLRGAGGYRLAEQLHGWTPGRPVAFAGFCEPTAARRALLERWGARGVAVREHHTEGAAGRAHSAAAADPDDEIALAAQWCRARLAADPRARLLVLVPDLRQRRQMVARTFEQVLTPQGVLGTAVCEPGACCAIEGGEPLAGAPLVRHALDALRLLTAGLDFPALSGWLRDSFWSAPDPASRARLEPWLRTALREEIDAGTLAGTLGRAPGALALPAVQMRAAIEHALGAIGSGPAAAHQWAQRFAAALAALGWPGSRPLTSAEQQTRLRFLELLTELGELGASLGRLTAAHAAGVLAQLAARTAFEPATGDPAVTLTDALGHPTVRYDGIWVAGLHADSWPPPVRIDPFIPLAAQRQAGIPEASPALTLRQARALLALWQRCADELVASWPVHGDDGEHLPSPLLAELPGLAPLASGPRRSVLARLARTAVVLERIDDGAGIAWPVQRRLPAGTRSIELQSRCPFRAYAQLRLGCEPLEAPRPGIDARDRGRLLHRTLELLWEELRDSAGLHAASAAGRLEPLIERCAARAVDDLLGADATPAETRARQRERRRTMRVVRELCVVELARAPFTVRARESRREITLARAALEVRIDRIDELADGTLAIFDYKSGRPQPQDWLGARPSHPQLLVYLLSVTERVSALAAVHLGPARPSFRGIADRKGRLPGVEALEAAGGATADEAWATQGERWRGLIEQLARDFLAGHAAVDPAPQACRTCHLHGFCRIGELDPADADGSTDE